MFPSPERQQFLESFKGIFRSISITPDEIEILTDIHSQKDFIERLCSKMPEGDLVSQFILAGLRSGDVYFRNFVRRKNGEPLREDLPGSSLPDMWTSIMESGIEAPVDRSVQLWAPKHKSLGYLLPWTYKHLIPDLDFGNCNGYMLVYHYPAHSGPIKNKIPEDLDLSGVLVGVVELVYPEGYVTK